MELQFINRIRQSVQEMPVDFELDLKRSCEGDRIIGRVSEPVRQLLCIQQKWVDEYKAQITEHHKTCAGNESCSPYRSQMFKTSQRITAIRSLILATAIEEIPDLVLTEGVILAFRNTSAGYVVVLRPEEIFVGPEKIPANA